MKYLIIWSPTTCQCTSRIFPSYNLFSNTANKLLIGSVRNQSGFIIDEKNVPHFMKVINPLTCDYNKEKIKQDIIMIFNVVSGTKEDNLFFTFKVKKEKKIQIKSFSKFF